MWIMHLYDVDMPFPAHQLQIQIPWENVWVDRTTKAPESAVDIYKEDLAAPPLFYSRKQALPHFNKTSSGKWTV